MPIKSYKPVTPTLRYRKTVVNSSITTDTPYKPLLVSKKRGSGRNNAGRITVRHKGGGHKRFIRIVDFKRNKIDIPGVVETVEYDPNRTSNIALVRYRDGERRYIIATSKTKVNDSIIASERCEIKDGNAMKLKHIPPGTIVHNIELRPGKGAEVARSAGAYAIVVAADGKMVQLKFPSSEVRNVHGECFATVGQVSNVEHFNAVAGSAGSSRHKGIRPTVRGVAMNPVDHPMGGGEGKTSGGGHPVSPWGQKSKGLKTRSNKKASNKYIVRRRNKK